MIHLFFEHHDADIDRAIDFAHAAHEGQRRKYCGTPYIGHPLAVGRILFHHDRPKNEVIAGILHDTVEDCDVTFQDITNEFGYGIRYIVGDLTDVSKPEDGNRAMRKAIDLEHTRNACTAAHNVKLVDLYHNTMSIAVHDKNFARTYLREKLKVLHAISDNPKVHSGLFQMAYDQCHTAMSMLGMKE